MMKSYYLRLLLFVGFFVAMIALWGLDVAGVRPRSETERRKSRVLPDLMEAPEASIHRVAIDRGDEHLVFERRGGRPGRWQMTQPVDVAAEPTRLDALVRNLRELHPVPDAGTVQGDPASYGLAPPAARVRLFVGSGEDRASTSQEKPAAELEIGKAETVRGLRYVRPAGGGITVVDSRLLSALDRPAAEWREPNMLAVPTFQVRSLAITRRDAAGKTTLDIRAERSRSGRWLLTSPIRAPADNGKIENLLGALSSLRVAEPPRGFVADNVKDPDHYGLASPPVTVELTTDRGDAPLVLDIGKAVPDEPERVYARQGGQDDVVMLEGRALTEIPSDAIKIRSQQVAEIVPAAVERIEIKTVRDVHTLEKDHGIWQILSPEKHRADFPAVRAFLDQMAELQTSEFLDPARVPDTMLDPPVMRIRIWQTIDRRASSAGTNSDGTGTPDASDALVLDLRTGRQDIARKTVFARLEGDQAILALPDKILDVFPKNPLAFRDRTMSVDDMARITKLTIASRDRTIELLQDKTGAPNAWRMARPVEGPADVATITQAMSVLCNLRAEEFAAPEAGNGKAFGLDQPLLRVDWESAGPHYLKIGNPVFRSASFYAVTDAQPMVFTVAPQVMRALDAEYRDHRVMSFPLARAARVVLQFAGRTLALRHRTPEQRGQVEWVPESGSNAEGLDLSRIGSLVTTMSQLQTTRFLQYEGEHPPETGLAQPRLTIEVTLGPKDAPRILRIGAAAEGAHVCAAVGTGSSGPVFLLPGPPWNELIRTGERFPDLPDDVFAPP